MLVINIDKMHKRYTKGILMVVMVLLVVVVLPMAVHAQALLTGTWRLKESNSFKGPDYVNALPLLITITQKPENIVLESTISNGEIDTIVRESIAYGHKSINESITKTGKKKTVLFQKSEDNKTWVKQTEIFTKEDSKKLQSKNKESFRVSPGGGTLSLLREYDGIDDPQGNEDFVIDGTYEKVMPEELAKEMGDGNGVNFAEGVSWEQVRAKAKKENKYIFVDCYATWCRPCKMMDKYVYPLKRVGEAMDDQFIAMKVQMDTAKYDANHIKMLYPLARKLEAEYNISVLPTYLFFSPDGKAVHKATGQYDAKKFIEMLAEVRNPEQQLYTLFNKARNRKLPWRDYPAFAKRLKDEFGEKELAKEVAVLYNKEYLNMLGEKELLTKVHLDFIGQFSAIVRSSDKIFQLCLEWPQLVDSIVQSQGGSWADFIVNRTITREHIEPLFEDAKKAGKEPDWVYLENQLTKKYNKELVITWLLDARVAWYEKKQKWTAYLQYLKPHLARHDLNKMNNHYLHYCAWYVFKYSDDNALINEALRWMDILINKWDRTSIWMVMDTKACLLYKLGRKKDGIALMKQIIQMFPQFNVSFQPRLESMNKGEDIWLIFQ